MRPALRLRKASTKALVLGQLPTTVTGKSGTFGMGMGPPLAGVLGRPGGAAIIPKADMGVGDGYEDWTFTGRGSRAAFNRERIFRSPRRGGRCLGGQYHSFAGRSHCDHPADPERLDICVTPPAGKRGAAGSDLSVLKPTGRT